MKTHSVIAFLIYSKYTLTCTQGSYEYYNSYILWSNINFHKCKLLILKCSYYKIPPLLWASVFYISSANCGISVCNKKNRQ